MKPRSSPVEMMCVLQTKHGSQATWLSHALWARGGSEGGGRGGR